MNESLPMATLHSEAKKTSSGGKTPMGDAGCQELASRGRRSMKNDGLYWLTPVSFPGHSSS
jgi:hypothetical protein